MYCSYLGKRDDEGYRPSWKDFKHYVSQLSAEMGAGENPKMVYVDPDDDFITVDTEARVRELGLGSITIDAETLSTILPKIQSFLITLT